MAMLVYQRVSFFLWVGVGRMGIIFGDHLSRAASAAERMAQAIRAIRAMRSLRSFKVLRHFQRPGDSNWSPIVKSKSWSTSLANVVTKRRWFFLLVR